MLDNNASSGKKMSSIGTQSTPAKPPKKAEDPPFVVPLVVIPESVRNEALDSWMKDRAELIRMKKYDDQDSL